MILINYVILVKPNPDTHIAVNVRSWCGDAEMQVARFRDSETGRRV